MTQIKQNYWLTSPMMRSDEVWKAQTLLAAKGARVRADGIYGTETAEAIKAFQARANLKSDGVMGPMTWSALNGETVTVPPPSSGARLSGVNLDELTKLHHRFPGGSNWKLAARGIEVDGVFAPFSSADHTLVERLLRDYTVAIGAIARIAPVPLELVIATICTESSGNLTKPRFEPGCDRRNPEKTPHRVSHGLMQTLLSTAREALDQPLLKLADLADAETSIRAGMIFMSRQSRRTGYDPPLVAAAYNAGSVIFNAGAENRWRLKQYPIGSGKHVDRFVRYFNAAIEAVSSNVVVLPEGLPSFAQTLLETPIASAPASPAASPVVSAAATILSGGTSADAARVPQLIEHGSTADGLKAARQEGARVLSIYPKNGCAVHLSALLQSAGIDVPMTAGAGKLAARIEARGWLRVPVRQQMPGDVGVCFDNDLSIPGSDHVYLVVARIDDDEMLIADNQRTEDAPHHRFATGRGKTPTEYFLRAP